MKNLYNIQEDQAAVAEVLEKIKKKSVLSTVIWAAMLYLKSNPKENIKTALDHAVDEWEKGKTK